MKYIHHVTLNSGHSRRSFPNEVNKELFFVLNRILRDAQKPGGAEIYEGYRLEVTLQGKSAIGTIYASDGAPILTTVCSPGDTHLWRTLHETALSPVVTDPEKPPAGAYVADRIEPGALIHMDAMKWTGDFSRCFGWIVLDPRKIR